MNPIVSALNVYPVKSIAATPVARAAVHPQGLAGDRRWVVVDAAGKAITGREVGELVRVSVPELGACALTLRHPDFGSTKLPAAPTSGKPVTTTVWGESVSGIAPCEAANRWISRVVGQPAKLVYMPDGALRRVDPSRSRAGDVVSFADAFPLLLVGEGSLAVLCARAGEDFSMARFRPNIVVSGTAPHAEDTWRTIRIGSVELEVADTCERCAFTTVDPSTGRRHRRQEPLRTLATYRRDSDGAIHFGVNLIARTVGTVAVGDHVSIG